VLLLTIKTFVVVLCFSNGVGRSGTFCAILSIIERLKSEQVMDVCQSIKVIRVNRPKAVDSKVRAVVHSYFLFVWIFMSSNGSFIRIIVLGPTNWRV